MRKTRVAVSEIWEWSFDPSKETASSMSTATQFHNWSRVKNVFNRVSQLKHCVQYDQAGRRVVEAAKALCLTGDAPSGSTASRSGTPPGKTGRIGGKVVQS